MAAQTPRTSLREGLRHAPKLNQPFIPDTAPVRRSHMNPNQSPPPPSLAQTHSMSPKNPDSPHIPNEPWEVKEHRVPMSTREVWTPGNRPGLFSNIYEKTKAVKQADFYDPYFPLRFVEVPKSDHIYKRAHYGLQSGISDEVDFALYHLVQISNQRGDKFKFEGFPLLAENLMEKAIEISVLSTGVKWELQYGFQPTTDRINSLNALHGTRDILERIKKIPVTVPDDSLETYEFNHYLRNIKEATLILRNMVLLKENAFYISRYASGLLRDFLVILINIPDQPRFNELKNDALDIAEEVTKYMRTDPEDPLWISLLSCLDSSDRAHVVRALWALTHFSTEVEEPEANRAMDSTPKETLQQLYFLTLVDLDNDVLSGTLDFWYQYSLSRENIEIMMDVFNFRTIFIPRMIALLAHDGRPSKKETVLQEEQVAPPPTEIPRVPPELLKDLMELSEPERSSRWLRCCFVEDADCEITQIALWQGYQSRFADPRIPGGGVLPAAEFIKNVSTTFTNAQAQVINGPGSSTRFIIKGIRPLDAAYTFDGFPYTYCKWQDNTKPTKTCQRAFNTPTDLRNHVYSDHMNLASTDTPGQYNLDSAETPDHTCLWDNCTKFRSSGPSENTAMVAGHVSSHLPEDRPADAEPPSSKRAVLQERIVRKWYYMDTPVSGGGEPVGVAYKAALVLRNIARNLPNGIAPGFDGLSWKKVAFLSHRSKIIEVWDRNRSLRKELTELIMILEKEEYY
ncbi:hypothetical protein BJX99DRAFT_54312 [Aspergillus californicus]